MNVSLNKSSKTLPDIFDENEKATEEKQLWVMNSYNYLD